MVNLFCPPCADDLCAEAALPGIVDHCEVQNDEKITEFFFTTRGKPLTGDPSLAASWTPRLSNLTTTGFPIRHISVIRGEKPLATLNYKVNRAGTSGRLDLSPRTNTYIIDDDSDEMYELMTTLQCNGNVLYWYRSNPHFYGGQDGIEALIKPSYGIVDGSDLAHRWSIEVLWSAKCEEPRVIAPF